MGTELKLQFLGVRRPADFPAAPGAVSARAIPLRRPDPVVSVLEAPAQIAALPPVGTTGSLPPFTFTTGWTAMTFSNASGAPPDVSVAVGPDHVVETINTAMAIYTKAGALVDPPGIISLDAFFGTDPFFAFDPKIAYDAASGRFFLVLVGFNGTTNEGRAWIAASVTSDPTGAWFTHVLTTETGAFPDFPGLGFTSDKVTVTANRFSLPDENFIGTEVFVINKAELIAGLIPSTVGLPPVTGYFAAQPAESQTPTSDQYAIAVDTFSFDFLHVLTINGLPGVNSVTLTDTVLPSNSGSFPPLARQPILRDYDASDDRFQRAYWRNGSLWGTATGACTPPGDGTPRACPRLVEISTVGIPTILQDFSYGVAGFDYSYAAPVTDALGNLAFVMSRSSPSELIGVHAAARLVTDPVNTASASAQLKAGEGPYDCLCGALNRWGDYSGAALDPIDGSFWLAGEYAVGAPASTQYATFIARLVLNVPTTTTTTTTSTTTTSTTTTSTTTTSTTTTSTTTTSTTTTSTTTTSTTTTSTTTTSTTTTSTTTTSTTTTSTTTTSTTTTTTPPPRGVGWPNLTVEWPG